MAIGWMTALKMVPWSDVIENAPTLVNGARKLLSKTRRDAPSETVEAAEPLRPASNPAEHLAQLTKAHEQAVLRIDTLSAEARETANLLKQLAEQQQTMVAAISVMRQRSRVLLATAIVLAVACVALAVAAYVK